MGIFKLHGEKLLLKELKYSVNFFLKESSSKGLIKDKTVFADDIASIASVGYGLASLVIAVERKWLDYDIAHKKTEIILDTFLKDVEGKKGFFYHFVNMETGKREWNSELSIIDTAIFICGALLAGEYFRGAIKEKAERLYKNINWNWYVDKEKNYFYMGYKPEQGFWGHWDMYAEQLMMYILGVASPTYPVSKELYNNFKRPISNYEDIENIIFSYGGSLFTYQYSHAWIDFRRLIDKDGINWFINSTKATKANRLYCIRNKERFKTFNENSWGLTACVGPKGYSGGYGAMPCYSDLSKENDGTVAPCGAIGSIVFTPEESIRAIEYYYNKYPALWGKYGLKDAYNLENKNKWFAKEYIGIDKGIEILMIENYLTGLIWKYMMKNKYITRGLKILEINNINLQRK